MKAIPFSHNNAHNKGKDFYIHGPDTLSDVVSVGTGNENEQHIVFDVKMFEIPCFFFAP